MGFFSKMGELLGIYEVEEDYPENYGGMSKDIDTSYTPSSYKEPVSFQTNFASSSMPEQSEAEQPFDYNVKSFVKGSPKVMNFSNDQIKMIIINPDSYDEARDICDYIKARKPVVVNLESMDYEIAQRVMDFLSGSCYSLNGNIQRVAKNIFIVAPDNIDVSSDFKSDVKGKSNTLPWMTFNGKTSTPNTMRG